jgi:hypothetical protein
MEMADAILSNNKTISQICLGESEMRSVKVRVKYHPTGGNPCSSTYTSVMVKSNPPTESEVSAAIRKKNPKWNFYILEIK